MNNVLYDYLHMKGYNDVTGFDWDDGNIDKNWINHQITSHECEEVFFDKCLVINTNMQYVGSEPRFQVFGNSKSNNTISIVFTLRKNSIRVISARKLNDKERKIYEKSIKKNTTI